MPTERTIATQYHKYQLIELSAPHNRKHLKYELTPVVFSLFSQYYLSYKRFNSLSLAIFVLNATTSKAEVKINEDKKSY